MGNIISLCLPFLLINLIQTIFFTNGPLRSLGYPDFNLLIVIFAGLSFSRSKTLEIAFTAGLIRELFSAGRIGPDILIVMAIGLLTSVMQEKIYQENPITLATSIFTIVLIGQTGFSVTDFHTIFLPTNEWSTILSISIISALIAIPTYDIWQKTFPKRKKYY